jgi:hypothetical protein
MEAAYAHSLIYVLPMVVILLVIRRNLRGRKIRTERLWLLPAILVAGAIYLMIMEGPPSPIGALAMAAGLVLGGVVGWYRGRLTRITLNPETHELTSQASTAGMMLIAVVFVARYALRMLAQPGQTVLPSSVHLNATLVTDVLMLFAVGLMTVQRTEMWLRCRKLLAEARAAGGPPTPTIAS